ncbi:hypothetical protein F4777DRAFT_537964 [Nemania sp. FL0916]|nr:hypothetical protein F4777DRAFT_537964 [Nemania sp. FL0916]
MGAFDLRKESTPFVNITTKAAFPVTELRSSQNETDGEEEPSISETPHPTDKVILSYCSELSDYTAPVTLFDAKYKVEIFQDSRGQPIIVTVGTDERLYALVHVNGLREGWQALDITPGSKDAKIAAFDATELDGNIFIAAAVRLNNSENVIYYASLATPTLSAEKLVLSGLDAGAIPWKPIPNNLGSKNIRSLNLSRPSVITIGTEESDEKSLSASHYIVRVDDPDTPWRDIPLPATAKNVLSLAGGRIKHTTTESVFTFFEDHDRTRRIIADLLDESESEIKVSYRLLTACLGDIKDFFVSNNPWGWSDVVVAGSKGIGFYDHEELSKEPRMIPGLQHISFKQVVCTEYGTETSGLSTINILAVSIEGDLYFIEGRRYYHDKSIVFECSGIPIRSNVRLIAAKFNGLIESSEICYVGTGSNEISHLYRDSATSNWTSNKIAVLTEEKSIKYKAYLTTLRFKNEAGAFVPRGYPVRITSSTPVTAMVNGRSSCITTQPTEFTTDQNGAILIAMPSTDVLAPPTLTVSLEKYNTGKSVPKYEVFTNLRILHLLKNKAPTADDLRNAVDENGSPLFDPNADFSAAASLMASFKDMAMTIEGEGESEFEKSLIPEEEKGWFENAVEVTGKFLGDVIQFLKRAVQGVVKIGIIAAKGLVKLLVRIGGKPMVFILETVGALAAGVLSAAAHLLGAAFKGLLELFGLWPDPQFVHETHEALSDIMTTLLLKADLFIETNRSSLHMAAEKLAEQGRKVIKDTRPAVNANEKAPKDNPIIKIINNPIIQALLKFNPISWILEAISEELDFGELGVSVPDFSPLLSIVLEVIPDLVMKELANLSRFFDDFVSKCSKVRGLDDRTGVVDTLLEIMGSVFWTLFDALKHIVFAIYDIAGDIFKQLKLLMEMPIKIPYLSKMFKDETGLEFSFLNVASYIMAFILSMGAKSSPAEKLKPTRTYLRSITAKDLDIKEKLGWNEPANAFEALKRQQVLTQQGGKLEFAARDQSDDPSFGLMSGE